MYQIQTLNKISKKGLAVLDENYTCADETENPDGIILRSFKMHDMELPESLRAVARAGAGVNNIPIDKCTDKGIVVFNTPGANANAVKEIVLGALFLASRKIVQGIEWEKTLIGSGDDIPSLVEKGKSAFAGPEIEGKTLGVVGLGAIGVRVANAAHHLGMNVIGFDPYLSVDAAWHLTRFAHKANSLDELLEKADYITIHVPSTPSTKGMFNSEAFAKMKKGARLLNFSRGSLVDENDVQEAIANGTVATYVTDFGSETLLKCENVICLPHLGASTPESEENCAVMAANEIKDFLENGNIKNSVNFPECDMGKKTGERITILHKNVTGMIKKITDALESLNIANMINKSKGDNAYTMIDVDGRCDAAAIDAIAAMPDVIKVTLL
ncbi:MAG: 3-phosphoglycerate dehydrogenase family protein [Eubacteriales bacterium]|nr:3-phosphoglycerate dehydrogenase family protein [Eubacteriales bacterium]MDY4214254.1 3-phosphoglycerate dehydrogenase family protein [Eubacteriales bacterium]